MLVPLQNRSQSSLLPGLMTGSNGAGQLQSAGDGAEPGVCARLAESAEERLFRALRREVFPFVDPRERRAISREIWMLEEELGCGHRFFSKVHDGKRRSERQARTSAAFEAEVAHALDPTWEIVDVPSLKDEPEMLPASPSSPQSAPEEGPSPTTPLGAPRFWLPVLRRCLSEEHDLTARSRLLREISSLEDITRLPSARDLEEVLSPRGRHLHRKDTVQNIVEWHRFDE